MKMTNKIVVHSMNELPELIDDGCGCKQSYDIMGIYKEGRQAVVICSQYFFEWFDEPEPIKWHTGCSERWDVTDELVGWCYLPSTDEFKEILQIGVKNEDCL